ncbi:MAG: lytic transglycosylase domain-containing protein [Thermoanaerobaculia bacterium]
MRRELVFTFLAALGAAAATPPAGAELVVLADGGVLRVTAYRAEGERMALDLASGGRLDLPIVKIARVVDDEIVPDPEPVADPDLPVVFDESQGVPTTPFGELIFEAARHYSLNPELVAAVVRAESAFDPSAVSAKGARGLMQLMPATALRFGLPQEEIHDPRRNLDTGARYLAELAARYERELPLVLAAYNAGEGTVARYGGVPPYRETREYIRRVYSFLGLEAAAPGS